MTNRQIALWLRDKNLLTPTLSPGQIRFLEKVSCLTHLGGCQRQGNVEFVQVFKTELALVHLQGRPRSTNQRPLHQISVRSVWTSEALLPNPNRDGFD